MGEQRKFTARSFQERKRAEVPITMVTAYDATFAAMFARAGVDSVLVGDSLGMVVQGHDSTLSVTVDEVIYHCRAVARRSAHMHVVGDMPFMSASESPNQAVRNAGRLLKEGCAHAVKVEGGEPMAPVIERLVKSGIPVMGHVGLMPQHVHNMGGFRVQGRTPEDADGILRDARAVQEAGAHAVVLEGIPGDLAQRVTADLRIATIGIGAGVHCDGQVLVSYDLLGLNPEMQPSFVKRYAHMFSDGVSAAQDFVRDVRGRQFPGEAHTFGASPTALRPVTQDAKRGGGVG